MRTDRKTKMVQVSVPAGKEDSGDAFTIIDLALIDRFDATFNTANSAGDITVKHVAILYAGTLKPMGFEGPPAEWLLEQFREYVGGDTMPKSPKSLTTVGKEGIIQRATFNPGQAKTHFKS